MFLKEEFPWGKALGRARERLTRGTAGEVILLWPPAPTRTISPSPTCPLTRGYGFIQGHTAKKPSCRALNASFTACWELVSNQGQHRFLRHNLSISGAPLTARVHILMSATSGPARTALPLRHLGSSPGRQHMELPCCFPQLTDFVTANH